MQHYPRKPALFHSGWRAFAAPCAIALAGLIGAAGCSTLRTTAPPSSHIEGAWQLDAAASDDAPARIQQYVEAQEQKMRAQLRNARNRGQRGDDEESVPEDGGADGADAPDDPGGNGPGGTPSGGGSGGRGRGGRGGGASESAGATRQQNGPNLLNSYAIKELRSQLQLSLTAARTLGIDRHGDTVSIAADGLPPRGYQPGEGFSRIDEIGTAQVASGWDGAAFVLRTHYSNRIERTERYELDPHTGKLIITRTINEPRSGKLALRSVYDRS
jgi:hypothetical protein